MDAKHIKTKTYGDRMGWIWTDMDQHTVDDMDRWNQESNIWMQKTDIIDIGWHGQIESKNEAYGR
jgi:plastocyanin